MTRLSCHRFRSKQVRLALSLLAYNLAICGGGWRLPQQIENWSLTSLQQRLVKTGGRLVKHARTIAGGRTSDTAAVRSNVGPYRSAAGTDGIVEMVVQAAAESVDKGLGYGEVLQKWDGEWGYFGSAGADRRPLEALQMKIISTNLRAGEAGVQ